MFLTETLHLQISSVLNSHCAFYTNLHLQISSILNRYYVVQQNEIFVKHSAHSGPCCSNLSAWWFLSNLVIPFGTEVFLFLIVLILIVYRLTSECLLLSLNK